MLLKLILSAVDSLLRPNPHQLFFELAKVRAPMRRLFVLWLTLLPSLLLLFVVSSSLSQLLPMVAYRCQPTDRHTQPRTSGALPGAVDLAD